MTLGLIDISGPAALLKSGVALYDAGDGKSFDKSVALELTDEIRPTIRLEREVGANGAVSGARRFTFIEAAPLEVSATVRVFDVLETATSEDPIRLYDSFGNAVLIWALMQRMERSASALKAHRSLSLVQSALDWPMVIWLSTQTRLKIL